MQTRRRCAQVKCHHASDIFSSSLFCLLLSASQQEQQSGCMSVTLRRPYDNVSAACYCMCVCWKTLLYMGFKKRSQVHYVQQYHSWPSTGLKMKMSYPRDKRTQFPVVHTPLLAKRFFLHQRNVHNRLICDSKLLISIDPSWPRSYWTGFEFIVNQFYAQQRWKLCNRL